MWKKLCQFMALLVVALAVFVGLGMQGYFDMVVVIAPLIRFAMNSGWLDDIAFPPVGDGVRPFFRCFGTNPEHFAKILGWKPAKEDVIISTFPKAGTHMMGQLVLQAMHDGLLDFESWNTELVVLEFKNANPDLCKNPRVMNASNYKQLAPNRPGLIVTHVPAPYTFFTGGTRHIVICRNPQDVLISFHNMLESFGGATTPDIYGVYRLFSMASQGWGVFYAQWWELSKLHPDTVLFLFYEDVVRDMEGTVRAVAKFLDHPLTEEAVTRVKHLASLDFMKKNEQKFDFPDPCKQLSPFSPRDSQRRLIHKGETGRGKGLPEDLKRDLRAQVFAGLNGSDFPIHRYYE